MEISVKEKGYINTLMEINGGGLVEELDLAMSKSVSSLLDHGGTAEVALKITMHKIDDDDSSVQIKTEVELESKIPEFWKIKQTMFITPKLGLSETDGDMPF